MTRPRKEPRRKHPQTRIGMAITLAFDAVEADQHGLHVVAYRTRRTIERLLATVCAGTARRTA